MKIYELVCVIDNVYYPLDLSASEQKLEKLIADVKAHDAKYVSYKDDDMAYLDWEESHPLQPYLNDLNCATGGQDLAYYLEGNKHEDGISWADFLEINERELNDFDPFAELHFYQPFGDIERYQTHGKGRHYYVFKKYNSYFVDIERDNSFDIKHDEGFETAEQAQAWCQDDYDKYYEGAFKTKIGADDE